MAHHTSAKSAFGICILAVLVIAQVLRMVISDNVIYNSGVAFDIHPPVALIYLFTASLLAVVCIWFFETENQGSLWASGLGLIVGGGLSNLIDRALTNGQVADYIRIFDAGVINFADIAIAAGILITLGNLYRLSR